MRSMTGYGTSEFINEKFRITVELKAYNNKYLDIAVNIPPWLNIIENRIIKKIKDKGIFRGRVEISIRIKELIEDISISIDNNSANTIIDGLKEIISNSGIDNKITISDIMGFDGIIKTEKKRDVEEVWSFIDLEIDNVLEQFLIEKEREGLSLKEDINSSLELIMSEVIKAQEFIPLIEEKIKLNFKEKFSEVLGHNIDENRILSELGILLVKYDINEEIVRLKSHIQNFKISSTEIPCGKKLDFICQEMNREINTIGSKSPIIEISQLVVNMKNSLEQIREQARNVE